MIFVFANVEYLQDAAPKSKKNEYLKTISLNLQFHTSSKYPVKFSISPPTDMDMLIDHRILY